MTGLPPDYEDLKPQLLEILRRAETAISEYDLLTALANEYPFFDISGQDTLALFKRHFTLYHCLYRLQQDLWAECAGHLHISALAIHLQPYQPMGQSGQLSAPDPLRTYYLDLHQLEATRQSDLDEMLGAFWQRLAQRDTRSEALKILGLADPIDDKAIKQRYRELVMTHHPDRGGDTARIQLLNAAMADLVPSQR